MSNDLLIKEAINDLKQSYPKIDFIDVSLRPTPENHFHAKIHSKIGRKRFFAQKRDRSLSKSLGRAKRAIQKQIESYKNKRVSIRQCFN